jgi:hypothetical protein
VSRFKIVSIQDVEPDLGNPEDKQPSVTELTGYVPLHRRITALIAAGINTAAVRDLRYYDAEEGDEFAEEVLSVIPRHLPPDLAELSEIARTYKQKRFEFEQKLRMFERSSGEPAADSDADAPPPEERQA